MRCSRTKAPSSTGVTRLPRYCGPLRHPGRPDLTLAGCRLARAAPPAGLPVLRPFPLPHVPSPLPRRNRSVLTSLASRPLAAFPVIEAGRLRVRRFEACAAFTSLRPAWSLNRPRRPLSSECFGRYRCLHRPPRLLPAGATVAGRDSHPLRSGAFHGALDHCPNCRLPKAPGPDLDAAIHWRYPACGSVVPSPHPEMRRHHRHAPRQSPPLVRPPRAAVHRRLEGPVGQP